MSRSGSPVIENLCGYHQGDVIFIVLIMHIKGSRLHHLYSPLSDSKVVTSRVKTLILSHTDNANVLVKMVNKIMIAHNV